jgi:hypothetical protein
MEPEKDLDNCIPHTTHMHTMHLHTPACAASCLIHLWFPAGCASDPPDTFLILMHCKYPKAAAAVLAMAVTSCALPAATPHSHQLPPLLASQTCVPACLAPPAASHSPCAVPRSGPQQSQLLLQQQDMYSSSRVEAMHNVEATIVELGSIFNQLADLVS